MNDANITDIGDITGEVGQESPILSDIRDVPPGQIPDDIEHSLLWLLDAGMEQSKSFCVSQNLPAPNTVIWENFSRPLLNKALLHYMPDSLTPESPAACLALGIIGIAAAHIPPYIAYKKGQNNPSQQQKIKNKSSVKQQIKEDQEESPDIAAEPEAPPEISDLILSKFGGNSGDI